MEPTLRHFSLPPRARLRLWRHNHLMCAADDVYRGGNFGDGGGDGVGARRSCVNQRADHSRLLQPKRLDDDTTGVVKFGRCLPRTPGQFCTLINGIMLQDVLA